jgi:hypothetical protein
VLRELVREAAEQGVGTFDYTLKFLPPYCPMLNPIELNFKDFKHEIRRLLDGPMHERVLGVIRQPWAQGIHERARLLHDAFEIAKDAITQERTLAHELHTVNLFADCLARQEL